jgi:hypothetical protein
LRGGDIHIKIFAITKYFSIILYVRLKAMDEKWEELAYELTTGTGIRSLTITPHFQKVSRGWFDTGQYTISEKGKPLGNIYVDLYTGGKPQWDGSKDEFTYKQIHDIVSHIVFKDVAHLPDPF